MIFHVLEILNIGAGGIRGDGTSEKRRLGKAGVLRPFTFSVCRLERFGRYLEIFHDLGLLMRFSSPIRVFCDEFRICQILEFSFRFSRIRF